jgi:hypothetical protein
MVGTGELPWGHKRQILIVSFSIVWSPHTHTHTGFCYKKTDTRRRNTVGRYWKMPT